jgi:hypothetical protein
MPLVPLLNSVTIRLKSQKSALEGTYKLLTKVKKKETYLCEALKLERGYH